MLLESPSCHQGPSTKDLREEGAGNTQRLFTAGKVDCLEKTGVGRVGEWRE